jgi:hypothetical protein
MLPPVAATAQPPDLTPSPQARRPILRRTGLVLLMVLGCLLVALSLIAAYVRVTVLNTDRFVDTMKPIAASPAVQQAVAAKLDTAISSKVDYDTLMQDVLPPKVAPYAPALGDALHNAIRNQLNRFVASDEFQTLWNDATRRAHARVVELLSTGESKRLTLQGDTVYLDFGAAVDRVRQRLQDAGLDRLAAAIPADVDGQVPLLKSEGFVKARDGVHLLETLTIVLPILALLCLAGHVALSRPRRRGLLRVALGLVVTALLMLALIGLGRSAYLDAINGDVLPREAAAKIFDDLISLLRNGVRAVAIVALVLAVLALVLGRTDRLRELFAGNAAIAWVAGHRLWLQGTVAVLGAIVLFAWDPPTAPVVLIDLALVAGGVLLIAGIGRTVPTSK